MGGLFIKRKDKEDLEITIDQDKDGKFIEPTEKPTYHYWLYREVEQKTEEVKDEPKKEEQKQEETKDEAKK
jgi:hypothetical protein